MRAEIIHFSLVDLGAELDLSRIPAVFGTPTQQAQRTTPGTLAKYEAFPTPLEVALDPARFGSAMPGVRIEARLHAIGAVAVRVRIPLEVQAPLDLVRPPVVEQYPDGAVERLAAQVAHAVNEQIRDALVQPYGVIVEPELYVVYALAAPAPPGLGVERAVDPQRALMAALVEAHPRPERLALETVDHALRHIVQYQTDDAAILGWERGVLLAPDGNYEDVLDIIELANLELLEFRTYDAYLDRKLGSAFEGLARLWGPGGIIRSSRSMLHELSEVRTEIVRLTDNLYDTRKLFGDWYLAKVHQRLSERFHLGDWEKAVESKLNTLRELFTLAGEGVNYRRGFVLELAVLLLFLLEAVPLIAELFRP